MLLFDLQRFTEYNRGILITEHTSTSQIDYRIRRVYTDSDGSLQRHTYYVATKDDVVEIPEEIEFTAYRTDEKPKVNSTTIGSLSSTSLEDQANTYIDEVIKTNLLHVTDTTYMTDSDKRTEFGEGGEILSYNKTATSNVTVDATTVGSMSALSVNVRDYLDTNLIGYVDTMTLDEEADYDDLITYLDSIIGDVVAPDTVYGTYSSNSGATVYWKVESTVTEKTESTATIRYETRYGLDTNYSVLFSTKTHNITTTNYGTYEDDMDTKINTEANAIKNSADYGLVNILLASGITTTYIPVTGIRYYYRISFTQSDVSFASNSIIAKTEYGTTDQYGHVFDQRTMTFDTTTYNTATQSFTDYMETMESHLKTMLDNRLGPINQDQYKYLSYYVSESGKRLYLRTTFTYTWDEVYRTETDYTEKDSVSIGYVVDWGFDGVSYPNQYTTGSYTITPSNYSTYLTDIEDANETIWNACIAGPIALWDVVVPTGSDTSYTNNGDITYQIHTEYAQGPTTDTTNSIIYRIYYSDPDGIETVNLYCDKTYTFDSTNYSTAIRDVQQLMSDEYDACKLKLNMPDLTVPSDTTETYTVRGKASFKIDTKFSKGSKINIIIIDVYVDGVKSDLSTSVESYGSVEMGDAEVRSVTASTIDSVKAICDTFPNDTPITSVSYYGFTFTHKTHYYKNSNNTSLYADIILDDIVFKTLIVSASGINNTTEDYEALIGYADQELSTILTTLQDTIIDTVTDTVTIGSVGYTISSQCTKTGYTVYYHGQTYTTGSTTIYSPIANPITTPTDYGFYTDHQSLSSIVSNITTLQSTAASKLDELRQLLLSSTPVSDSDTYTTNGFSYTISTTYSKTTSLDEPITARVYLDNILYDTITQSISIETLDNNCKTIEYNVNTSIITLEETLSTSPSNDTIHKTVNGFHYHIDKTYTKTAGETTATASVYLDGVLYKSQTNEVSVSSLSYQSIQTKMDSMYSELVSILETSPSDTIETEYTIDGFRYYLGAQYLKSEDSDSVTINICLDKQTLETYTLRVTADTPTNDISSIKTLADTKIEAVLPTLGGILPYTTTHTIYNMSFSLKESFTKDPDVHTITYTTYVDDEVYKEITIPFDHTKLVNYKEAADSELTEIETKLDLLPEDYSTTYTKNGFSYTLSFSYTKSANTRLIYMTKAFDSHNYGDPDTHTFSIHNLSGVTTFSNTVLSSLKASLDSKSPADTETVYTIGGFNWYTSITYSKDADDDQVTITLYLDREIYETLYTDFNINDNSVITTKVSTALSNLQARLSLFPTDSTEIYTIRYMAWLISKRYIKRAGNKTVTTYVFLDTHQYHDSHTEDWTFYTYDSVQTYNNDLVDLIKQRINTFAPTETIRYREVDDRYTNGKFYHIIDIDYYKEAGTDDIVVKFSMDNNFFVGYTDNIYCDIDSFSTNDILYYTEEIMAAAKAQSRELSYLGNEQAARLLGMQVITA